VQKPRPNGEQLRMLFALESALWPGFGPSHQDLPASRTDAGVSALGQVIVFDAALSVSPPEKGQSIDIETGRPALPLLVDVHRTPFTGTALALPSMRVCHPICRSGAGSGEAKSFDVGSCRWKRYR
jgi:hypothetical protein